MQPIKIIIICVNYNSYPETESYLRSIDHSAEKVKNSAQITVAIADNSPIPLRQPLQINYPNIKILPFILDNNDGYLGSAEVVMLKLRESEKLKDYNFCIISNVDLTLSETFFTELTSTHFAQNIGWIAPDIHTKNLQKHENPFIEQRPSLAKINFWILLYKYPILFYCYSNLSRLHHSSHKKHSPKQNKKNIEQLQKKIYAGHGSIMIFTKIFIDSYQEGNFQSFMYGEEIYFAERVRESKLITIYTSNIKVLNQGGVSTNLLGLSRKAKMNYDSLQAIKNEFFKIKSKKQENTQASQTPPSTHPPLSILPPQKTSSIKNLVSIITPSHNSSKFICETIDSIISQSYEQWELLITDDASTDDTCKIVESYTQTDPRIKLFKLKSPQGAAHARNKSLNEATGEYIAFCDSDDRWFPEKLEKQINFMQKKSLDVCYSSYIECDENNNNLGIMIARKSVKYKDMIKCDYIGFLTLIAKREKITKLRFPPLKKRQDWAYKLLIMQKIDHAESIMEPLAYYRVRSGSLSSKKLGLIKYNIAVYQKVLNCSKLKSCLTFILKFLPSHIKKRWLYTVSNR
ncbi:MAG: glycosyltransferase family 2 protein [Rikenellaceae bacterium]